MRVNLCSWLSCCSTRSKIEPEKSTVHLPEVSHFDTSHFQPLFGNAVRLGLFTSYLELIQACYMLEQYAKNPHVELSHTILKSTLNGIHHGNTVYQYILTYEKTFGNGKEINDTSFFLEAMAHSLLMVLFQHLLASKFSDRREVARTFITSSIDECFPTLIKKGEEKEKAYLFHILQFVQDIDLALSSENNTELYGRWSRFFQDQFFYSETLSIDTEFTTLQKFCRDIKKVYTQSCFLFFTLEELSSKSYVKPTAQNIESILQTIEILLGDGFNSRDVLNEFARQCSAPEYIPTLFTDPDKKSVFQNAFFTKLDTWAETKGISIDILDEIAKYLSHKSEGVRNNSVQFYFRVLDCSALYISEEKQYNPPAIHPRIDAYTPLDMSRIHDDLTRHVLQNIYPSLARIEKMYSLLLDESQESLLKEPITYMDIERELRIINEQCPEFRDSFYSSLRKKIGAKLPSGIHLEEYAALIPIQLADLSVARYAKRAFEKAIIYLFTTYFSITEAMLAEIDKQWAERIKRNPVLRQRATKSALWIEKNRLHFGIHAFLSALIATEKVHWKHQEHISEERSVSLTPSSSSTSESQEDRDTASSTTLSSSPSHDEQSSALPPYTRGPLCEDVEQEAQWAEKLQNSSSPLSERIQATISLLEVGNEQYIDSILELLHENFSEETLIPVYQAICEAAHKKEDHTYAKQHVKSYLCYDIVRKALSDLAATTPIAIT